MARWLPPRCRRASPTSATRPEPRWARAMLPNSTCLHVITLAINGQWPPLHQASAERVCLFRGGCTSAVTRLPACCYPGAPSAAGPICRVGGGRHPAAGVRGVGCAGVGVEHQPTARRRRDSSNSYSRRCLWGIGGGRSVSAHCVFVASTAGERARGGRGECQRAAAAGFAQCARPGGKQVPSLFPRAFSLLCCKAFYFQQCKRGGGVRATRPTRHVRWPMRARAARASAGTCPRCCARSQPGARALTACKTRTPASGGTPPQAAARLRAHKAGGRGGVHARWERQRAAGEAAPPESTAPHPTTPAHNQPTHAHPPHPPARTHPRGSWVG